MSCHCALARTVAPRLLQAGTILASELYAASSVTTLVAAIGGCSREFSLQLLQADPQLKLSQLAALDTCVANVMTLGQCGAAVAQPAPPRANNTQAPGAAVADAAQAVTMWDEVLRESHCALVAAASAALPGGAQPTNCSALLPQSALAGGARAASSFVDALLGSAASSPGGSATSVASPAGARALAISTRTTREPVTWRAGCWCSSVSDPVCDPLTRKQFPNPCSAGCQVRTHAATDAHAVRLFRACSMHVLLAGCTACPLPP